MYVEAQKSIMSVIKQYYEPLKLLEQYKEYVDGQDVTFNDAIVSAGTVLGTNNVIRLFKTFGDPKQSLERYKAVVNFCQIVKSLLEARYVVPYFRPDYANGNYKETIGRMKSPHISGLYFDYEGCVQDIERYVKAGIVRCYSLAGIELTKEDCENIEQFKLI